MHLRGLSRRISRRAVTRTLPGHLAVPAVEAAPSDFTLFIEPVDTRRPRQMEHSMTTSNPTSPPRTPRRLQRRGYAVGPCGLPAWQRDDSWFNDNRIHRYSVAVIGVLITSFLVSRTNAHEDYIRADRAWFYMVLLSIGCLVSGQGRQPPSRRRLITRGL